MKRERKRLELSLKKGDVPAKELDLLQRFAAVEADRPNASVCVVIERWQDDDPHFEVLTPGEALDFRDDGPVSVRVYALSPDEIVSAAQEAIQHSSELRDSTE